MKLMRTTIFSASNSSSRSSRSNDSDYEQRPNIAHAAVKEGQCPNSTESFCIIGGTGQQGGGGGGRSSLNIETGDASASQGAGHTGGLHATGNVFTGQSSCVGSACP
jgi:hypothetical protein